MSDAVRFVEDGSDGKNLRIAILVARFNPSVTEALLQGALAACARSGVPGSAVLVAYVPGAFELPGAAAAALRSSFAPDAVVCLGAVIRGGTPHFEYVCQAATEGILRVGLDSGKPVIFGVLTVDNDAQALERAGLLEPEGGWQRPDHDTGSSPVSRNKGAESAMAAIEAANLYRALRMVQP